MAAGVTVQRLVVGRAAAHGQLLAIPAAIANVVLADQDPKPKAALNGTFLALVVAFAVSGYVAGREAPEAPAVHGALAGLVTFAFAQVIGVLGRLDRGDAVPVGQVIALAVLAALVAMAASAGGAARARSRADRAEREARAAPGPTPPHP